MHVHFEKSKSARVTNITIDAPGESPNTDGIHVSGSSDVIIDHCQIGTGNFGHTYYIFIRSNFDFL